MCGGRVIVVRLAAGEWMGLQDVADGGLVKLDEGRKPEYRHPIPVIVFVYIALSAVRIAVADATPASDRRCCLSLPLLWLLLLVAQLGGWLFGIELSVISGVKDQCAKEFHVDKKPFQLGIIATGMTIGAALGTVIAGPLQDGPAGRKYTTVIGCIVYVGGAAITCLSQVTLAASAAAAAATTTAAGCAADVCACVRVCVCACC